MSSSLLLPPVAFISILHLYFTCVVSVISNPEPSNLPSPHPPHNLLTISSSQTNWLAL